MSLNWNTEASETLKLILKQHRVTYIELSEALRKIGVNKTPNNLAVLINRGTFPFSFVLQCAKALEIKKITTDYD